MRLFAKSRSRLQSGTVRIASSRTVEMLESRTLLNATLSSAIAPVTETPGGTAATVDLSGHFSDSNVPGTLVEIQTPLGNIPVALTDAQTPGTVANFKEYITSGRYDNVIVHRSVPGFVIQGGGYTTNGVHIADFGMINGEPGIPNNTGTIAMALSNGPNSGTSEWFINLANNTQLNDTSDGGPFTVFGRVIYNGMSVASAIAALPIVNDSQTTSPAPDAFSALPAVNYSGPSTASSVDPSNMVVTNTVIVAPLAYSVSSDNPSLVNPSLTGTTLTLTPGSGTGIANITVTATDVGGNVATSHFQVGVGVAPSTSLTTPLGAGGAKQIRFTDADGTSTIVSLNGPGTATLNVAGTVAGQSLSKSKILTVSGTSLQLASIAATGTTSATTITITGHGGNGVVELGGISTDGALKGLNARTTALSGASTINGAVGSLNLGSGAGSLSTTAIGRMTVKGAFSDNLSAASITSFTAGSITGGTWTVTGNAASVTAGSISNWTASFGTLGKLTSKGAITNSTVHSAGNVGNVAASSLSGSTLFAGVTGSSLPAALTDFSAAASLANLRVKSFVNSNIAAQTLGRLTLGAVTTANGGTPFGVAGHTIQALTASSGGKTLRLKNVASQADVDSAITSSGLVPGDFLVRIV